MVVAFYRTGFRLKSVKVMEEVFEPLGRFILRVIKWIIIDAFMEFVLKGTGHVVLFVCLAMIA